MTKDELKLRNEEIQQIFELLHNNMLIYLNSIKDDKQAVIFMNNFKTDLGSLEVRFQNTLKQILTED